MPSSTVQNTKSGPPPFCVAFLRCDPKNPVLCNLPGRLAQDGAFTVCQTESFQEAVNAIRSSQRGLAFFEIKNQEDFQQVLHLLTKLAPLLRAEVARVCGFIQLKTFKVEGLLRRRGCTELLPYELPARAFSQKLDRWLRYVSNKYSECGAVPEVAPAPKPVTQSAPAKKAPVRTATPPPATAAADTTATDWLTYVATQDAPQVWKNIAIPIERRLTARSLPNGLPVSVSFLDYFEQTLIFDCPTGSFSAQNKLELHLLAKDQESTIDLTAQGAVDAIENNEPGKDVVTLLLENSKPELFPALEEFVKKILKRQHHVSDFFQAAKD